MTPFQQLALLLIAIWILIVVVRYRNSRIVLIGGLLGVALYTLSAVVEHEVSFRELGLSISASWISTIGFPVAWLALMLAYSPLADRLATRWVAKPPTLKAFRVLQESRIKLLIGIVSPGSSADFSKNLSSGESSSSRLKHSGRPGSPRLSQPLSRYVGGGGSGSHASISRLASRDHRNSALRLIWRTVCRKRVQPVGRHLVPRTLRHDRVRPVCQQEIQLLETGR